MIYSISRVGNAWVKKKTDVHSIFIYLPTDSAKMIQETKNQLRVALCGVDANILF